MQSVTRSQYVNKLDLVVGSLNVRGINNEHKRISLYNWGLKHKFDMLFLQETYSCKENEPDWCKHWNGEIIFAHGTKHSKGTMILVREGLNCKIIEKMCDVNGRFIILKVDIEGQLFYMINIYAPNKENEKMVF